MMMMVVMMSCDGDEDDCGVMMMMVMMSCYGDDDSYDCGGNDSEDDDCDDGNDVMWRE